MITIIFKTIIVIIRIKYSRNYLKCIYAIQSLNKSLYIRVEAQYNIGAHACVYSMYIINTYTAHAIIVLCIRNVHAKAENLQITPTIRVHHFLKIRINEIPAVYTIAHSEFWHSR